MLAPARWLPCTALATVALLQIVLAHAVNLSAWLGGGFGMFATIDSPMNRTFVCEGIDERGAKVPIRILFTGLEQEGSFDGDDRFRLLTLPLETDLRRLGRVLLAAEFVPDTPPFHRVRLPQDGAFDAGAIVRLRAIRIDVLSLSFETSQARLGLRPVTSVVVDRNR
jgi:hypothetical protein